MPGEIDVTKSQFRYPFAVATVLWGLMGTPSVAHAPVPLALQVLEKGAWEVKPRSPGEEALNICLGDPRQLLQLYHQRSRCTFHVLENHATSAVVHYTCRGSGQGRTALRIETSRLAQIHTQGVAKGQPFALAYEARHKGECH